MTKRLFVNGNHADAGADFVKSQLRIALNYLKIAEHSDERRRARYVEPARRTHENVVRFMLRTKLRDDDFAYITANSELLKFKLAALKKSHANRGERAVNSFPA